MDSQITELKTEFEFLYFARGRHLCADQQILNAPIEVIRQFGGVESLTFVDHGLDNIDENYSRGFDFEVRVFNFPFETFKAYLTRESYPQIQENFAKFKKTAKFSGESFENSLDSDNLVNYSKFSEGTNDRPAYRTRIRLGNYGFKNPVVRELSEKLSKLPASDLKE